MLRGRDCTLVRFVVPKMGMLAAGGLEEVPEQGSVEEPELVGQLAWGWRHLKMIFDNLNVLSFTQNYFKITCLQ